MLLGASAFTMMASTGDTRNGIEHTTRMLCENQAAMRGILARKRQLFGGMPNVSAREHEWLNQKFEKLFNEEEELHLELQRLIVQALEQQMDK